jgi:hypothetical protein
MGNIASLATPIGKCTTSVVSTPCFLVSSRVDRAEVKLDGVQAAMVVPCISEISNCHPADLPNLVDQIMLALEIISVRDFSQSCYMYMLAFIEFHNTFMG